ncbi:MAG: hypothetical protein ACREEM_33020 [Blastocatellia bacterium]
MMTFAIELKKGICRVVLVGGLLSIPPAAYSQTNPVRDLPRDSIHHSDSETAGILTQLSHPRWILSENPSVAASISGGAALSRGQSSLSKTNISEIAQLTNAIARWNWSLRIDIENLATAGSSDPISTTIITGPTSLPRGSSSVQPRLNAFVEMQNGKLVLRLKNTDGERSFTGVVRVTSSDGKNEDGVAPVAIELQPDEEKFVAIEKPSLRYGDSMFMVYDDRKTLRIIRSAPFGVRPKPANAQSEPRLLEGDPVNQPGIVPVAEIEANVNSLGEDNDSAADPANPAFARKDVISLNITGVFEGEIEGGPAPGPAPTPASKNAKPNQ